MGDPKLGNPLLGAHLDHPFVYPLVGTRLADPTSGTLLVDFPLGNRHWKPSTWEHHGGHPLGNPIEDRRVVPSSVNPVGDR